MRFFESEVKAALELANAVTRAFKEGGGGTPRRGGEAPTRQEGKLSGLSARLFTPLVHN